MSFGSRGRIWLVSEKHRRSSELCMAFEADLCEILSSDNQIPIRGARYVFVFFKTISVLLSKRPKVVFVQNPSLFLTAMVCGLRGIFKYRLIVDRHSNFKLKFVNSKRLKWKLFYSVSDFTIRCADLTIVTNQFLAELVEAKNGNSFVLPDKLPQLDLAKKIVLDGQKNIVVVCTFSEDEPIEELIDAALLLPKEWVVHFTGNEKKAISAKRKKELEKRNIKFTGFIPEKAYQSLLCSADLLVVLTTEEYLLTCGAYEAISLGKALVVSKTKTIKSYFRKGVIYTNPDPESIVLAIKHGISNLKFFENEILSFREELFLEWKSEQEILRAKIEELL